MEEEANRLGALRDQLEKGLTAEKKIMVNGSRAHRLPHVTNLTFEGIPGDQLLAAINRTIAVSSGSACTSANPEPSHVLKAMQLSDDSAKSAIRFGLGRFTTREEIAYTIDKIKELMQSL